MSTDEMMERIRSSKLCLSGRWFTSWEMAKELGEPVRENVSARLRLMAIDGALIKSNGPKGSSRAEYKMPPRSLLSRPWRSDIPPDFKGSLEWKKKKAPD